MVELKFFMLCFMIAAPQGALGSAAEEFVEKWVDAHTYVPNLKGMEQFSVPSPEECFSEAVTRGAQAVRLDQRYCNLDFLFGSVCPKEEGQIRVYVLKDFLTNGTQYDMAENEETFRYFATTLNGFTLLHSKTPAFVDPSCYTTSVCSYMVMTTAPEISASELLILYDICGQTIQVDSGKSFYVLSHEGIGCKYFPNDYPVADCWVEFTGAGEITINVTFVNFRESDQCDGFTMTAVADDANGSSASTDLCDATAPTELTSAGGKVRIEFRGSASPTREKYGFDIQVTAE